MIHGQGQWLTLDLPFKIHRQVPVHFNGSQRLLYNPLESTRLAQLEMVSSRSGILMGTGQSDLPRPSTGKGAQAAASGNGGLALPNPQVRQTYKTSLYCSFHLHPNRCFKLHLELQ